MRGKIFFILMGVLIFMSGCSSEKKAEEKIYQGNLISIGKDDFKDGQLEGLEINSKGQLVLKEGSLEGSFQSPLLKTEKFKELVGSWNVNTPLNTQVELLVRVKIEDEWTPYFSYGAWTRYGNRGSIFNQEEKFAQMSIDTLELLFGKDSEELQFTMEVKRDSVNDESPLVKSIHLALKLKDEEKYTLGENVNYLVELDVPERSQMIVPEIGNIICSPTSLSMVMEYLGHDIDTTEVAANVLDKGANIYGNWSYNVAYAGEENLSSYVARFTSVDEIKEMIGRGIPVVASIKTTSEKTLVGAPQTYPAGHLIVIRGFSEKDGEEYVIVNDPAAPEVETVRREYKVSGFEKAWNNMVYILDREVE